MHVFATSMYTSGMPLLVAAHASSSLAQYTILVRSSIHIKNVIMLPTPFVYWYEIVWSRLHVILL